MYSVKRNKIPLASESHQGFMSSNKKRTDAVRAGAGDEEA